MIQISNGEILYCGYFIADMKIPFIKLKTAPQYTKLPSETILSSRMSYYTFSYNNNYYRLIRSTKNGFKFHSIYRTDTTVKKSAREIILNECLDNKELRWSIINYLQKITNILIGSHPFSLIITDFKMNFDTGIQHILGDWNIINTHNIEVMKRNMYEGNKIKISECGKELKYIDPVYYTDIDKNIVKEYKNILILSKTNGHYTNYLAEYFYKLGAKEVLPVTLFLM